VKDTTQFVLFTRYY